MTTVGAFNDLMGEFLDELVKTFPDEKAMKSYQESFEIGKMTNERLPLKTYMAQMSQYSSYVTKRDEAFFLEHEKDIPILVETSLAKYWPTLSANTKNVIWSYLNNLYVLGSLISMIPPETASAIENIAQQLEGKIDEDAMMGALMGMLGNVNALPQPGKKKNK
jgi:hypothetical protein